MVYVKIQPQQQERQQKKVLKISKQIKNDMVGWLSKYFFFLSFKYIYVYFNIIVFIVAC